jgi:hypothetical protein
MHVDNAGARIEVALGRAGIQMWELVEVNIIGFSSTID